MNKEWSSVMDAITDLHVVVIGDVMIDSYAWGAVDRVSPEAPVPIIEIDKTEDRLGGAANAALNCRALGAKVTLASVIGKDLTGEKILGLCEKEGIESSLIMQSEERRSTKKTRILSHDRQVMRLDQEDKQELSIKEEHKFIEKVLKFLQIEKPDVVIFEDYNKGVLKENVIDKIINHCQLLSIITAVDPKKKNFLAYRGVTLFKPNLKELKEGLNLPALLPEKEELYEAHQLLKSHLEHQISLFTLSEYGMFYAENETAYWTPAHQRKIRDVSGAGDTVISVATLVYAASKDMKKAIEIANLAGGLVCEYVGVRPIDKLQLINSINQIKIK